jgi:hypothetical protein
MKKNKPLNGNWLVLCLLACIAWSLAVTPAWAAKPKLTISKASWSGKKGGSLTVKGRLLRGDAGTNIALFDINGKPLGAPTQAGRFAFIIPGAELAIPNTSSFAVPCSVRVQAGDLESVKSVAGNPNKACRQAPRCQITAPADGVAVQAGSPVSFAARATFPNKKVVPKYEWDFGGGAMGEDVGVNSPVSAHKRPDSTSATTTFVRDNSRYRVRFTAYDSSVAAMESRQYRCEDAVEIVVGTPPDTLPDFQTPLAAVRQMARDSQQAAPRPGKELAGVKNDLVVLPFEDLTLQCSGDGRTSGGGFDPGEFRYPGINAVVYRKDLKSPVVAVDTVKLRYSAASNPHDPVGPDSINTTSQNWPLNAESIRKPASLQDAKIQKTDWWGLLWLYDGDPVTDKGSRGQAMPGYDNPYAENAPQLFNDFLDARGIFQAPRVPLTDIDDTGKVNPFPLLRIEAVDAASGEPVTNSSGEPVQTDIVQTSGKDFHCRGCHATGKIAAKSTNQWQPSAYRYSVWNAAIDGWGGWDKQFQPPEFQAAKNVNGPDGSNLFDQEYDAIVNLARLHEFYDYFGVADYTTDGPHGCAGCHPENHLMEMFGGGPYLLGATRYDEVYPQPATTRFGYDIGYSMNIHKFHGQLQFNDARNDILRKPNGLPQRWVAEDHAAGARNDRSLFPVKGQDGSILPMEQNCLQCHAGQRDQCYRDRMFTAGVTCYQCHGDMLAIGKAYKKQQVGTDGHALRQDWYDQPDCGSCHTGNANRGKGGNGDYFSAGVMKLAFDETDLSATTRPVDWSNPDASRFAVPLTQIEPATRPEIIDQSWAGTYGIQSERWKIQGPLYRLGKDTHGNVPCAACHGGAHAVWPNRDPNANDNVTAMQLQGHTGTILECNVCHDKDAFKREADLDGSAVYSHDPKPWVLGGPHNTHPIDDPKWWKAADGDGENADGTTYGGWHNNYAKRPGKANEDQCAACHGNDHKGTRLSRTPVDRVFDFTGFDFKKLKKAGFKSRVVKVAAGTPIGCNTCHNIATSCIGSPVGDQLCGKASETVASSTNHAPVFADHHPAPTVIDLGGDMAYSYTPDAPTDTDHDTLTFSLGNRLDTEAMSIDPLNGKVTVTDWTKISFPVGLTLPYHYDYVINVTDGKSGYDSQKVTVEFTCPSGQIFQDQPGLDHIGCAANHDPTLNLIPFPTAVVGQAYDYMVFAAEADGQRYYFTLDGQPEGMAIGYIDDFPQGNLLQKPTGGWTNLLWTPSALGSASFEITVRDGFGGISAPAAVTLHVCNAGETWADGCIANQSPVIGSLPPNSSIGRYTGATVGETYTYEVKATDAESDTLSYSLYGPPPPGMTIDAHTGVVTWTPPAADEFYRLNFVVAVTDGRGGVVTQGPIVVIACPPGKHYHSDMFACMAD